EIETRNAVEIAQVLTPQRLVETELALVFLRHLVDPALHIAAERGLLQQFCAHRVLPREARQKEIETGGEPDDQQKYAKAARDIGGLHGPLTLNSDRRPLAGMAAGRRRSLNPTPLSCSRGALQVPQHHRKGQVPMGA